MEGSGTRKPRPVIEANDIDDESVAFPMSHRITHVTGEDIVRMLGVQGNHAEHIHVFIEKDDLFRRLNDLLGKQSQHDRSWHAAGEATCGGIIDRSIVEGFEYLLRGP